MYEANMPLLLLAMAAVYLVLLRWPKPPRPIRWLIAVSLVLFAAANWWWSIRLPIDRDAGRAIDIVCAVIFLIVGILTMLRGRSDVDAVPEA